MNHFTNQSRGSHRDHSLMGRAMIRRFALFPMMLLMLLLLPAGMVAQPGASRSNYIATYDSTTQTLTFKKYTDKKLPNMSGWVQDGMQVGKQFVFHIAGIKHVVLDESFETFSPTTLNQFFANLAKLETITGLEYLNTENVTDMSSLFYGCGKLTSLDLSHFNTANVTNMSSMFKGCTGLTSLDVTNFNTANVTDMYNMFGDCWRLASLDVTLFNTANVTNMDFMFFDCLALTSLDVTHFNTAKVEGMSGMFAHCSSLTSLDVTHFNTEKVTNMSQMFNGCACLASLDVTNFNTANVSNMEYMFCDGSNLKAIYASDKFVTNAVTKSSGMFEGCKSLSPVT